MTSMAAQLATGVKPQNAAFLLTTFNPDSAYELRMSQLAAIHHLKQGPRPPFIPAWAEHFNLNQADVARELGADKSLVSRWFSGSTPQEPWQEKLAALFHTEPNALFRHPDEDWIASFFAGREREEVERIKKMLEAGYPKQRRA